MTSGKMTLEEIFYYDTVKCDYSKITEEVININCFYPIPKITDSIKLYQKGFPTELKKDIIGVERSETSPSIWVFENFSSFMTLNVEYCIYRDDSIFRWNSNSFNHLNTTKLKKILKMDKIRY